MRLVPILIVLMLLPIVHGAHNRPDVFLPEEVAGTTTDGLYDFFANATALVAVSHKQVMQFDGPDGNLVRQDARDSFRIAGNQSSFILGLTTTPPTWEVWTPIPGAAPSPKYPGPKEPSGFLQPSMPGRTFEDMGGHTGGKYVFMGTSLDLLNTSVVEVYAMKRSGPVYQGDLPATFAGGAFKASQPGQSAHLAVGGNQYGLYDWGAVGNEQEVQVFVRVAPTPLAPVPWVEEFVISATPNQYFGAPIASGRVLAVPVFYTPIPNIANYRAAEVHVYAHDGVNWNFMQIIPAPTMADTFGLAGAQAASNNTPKVALQWFRGQTPLSGAVPGNIYTDVYDLTNGALLQRSQWCEAWLDTQGAKMMHLGHHLHIGMHNGTPLTTTSPGGLAVVQATPPVDECALPPPAEPENNGTEPDPRNATGAHGGAGGKVGGGSASEEDDVNPDQRKNRTRGDGAESGRPDGELFPEPDAEPRSWDDEDDRRAQNQTTFSSVVPPPAGPDTGAGWFGWLFLFLAGTAFALILIVLKRRRDEDEDEATAK